MDPKADNEPPMAAPAEASSIERAVRMASTIAAIVALFFAACGVARYRTYTNETFDLAFYTRITWGMLHGDLWEPILGAHLLGLRLPLVLVPVGVAGLAIGIPVALYLAQGLAVAFAAHRLARIGARHFGVAGAWAGALGLVLHPNVGHVVAYEAHPGTIALAPLALIADALDRRDARTLLAGTIGVLICREDLALVAMLAAVALAYAAPRERRLALASCGLALAYLLVFALVLHPRFKPAHGSLEAHFGPWGNSSGAILRTLITEPGRVLSHLGSFKRLTYLPRILLPLALLPLLSPRTLWVAAPVLAINLLSHFPTTTRIDSHYLTPALPLFVLGAIDGARWLDRKRATLGRRAAIAVPFFALGGTLVSGLFSPLRSLPRFVHPPVDVAALDRLVAAVPARASAQAPDPILPHLATRHVLHRAAPFAHDDDAIVLDLGHRLRFAHSEDLLRTTEEPVARTVLARLDRRVVSVAGPYLLLLRDRNARVHNVDRMRIPPRREPPVRLCDCLSVLRVVRAQGRVAVDLVATGPCPSDLALRLGPGERPRRVDLLFDGQLSPAHLRAGDFVRSYHDDPSPGARTIHVGVLRSSGARPAPEDPFDVALPIL